MSNDETTTIEEKDDPFWQEAMKRAWAVPDRPLGIEDLKELFHAALLHGAKMGIAAQQNPPKLQESVEFQNLWAAIEAFDQAGKQTDRSPKVAGVNTAITALIAAFRRITITTRVNPKIAPRRINDAYEKGRIDGQTDAIMLLTQKRDAVATRRGELQMEVLQAELEIHKIENQRTELIEDLRKLHEERKAEKERDEAREDQ